MHTTPVKFIDTLLALALVSLLMLLGQVRVSCAEDGFANAKVGEWVEWKTVTRSSDGKEDQGIQRREVTARDADSVTLKFIVTINGRRGEREQRIDLNAKSNSSKSKAMKTEVLGEGNETIKVNGKSYTCQWVKTRNVIALGEQEWVTTQTIWTNKSVPLGGKVQSVIEKANGEVETHTLTGFGR